MEILYQIEQGKVFDDGYHEIFSEKKTFKYTFTFKNGKLDGRYLEFCKKMEYFFIPKWIKTGEIFFKDGKKEGKCYRYSHKREGIIVDLSNYENGLLQGEQLSFSDEGDIESSSFGPHGLVTSISNYKDGKHHGLFKSYNVREYDSVTLRTLSETGQYVEDEQHGEWISYGYYDDSVSTSNYNHGKQHGEFTSKDDDGKWVYVEHYENDELKMKQNYTYDFDGLKSIDYSDKDGKIFKQDLFEHGEFVETIEY